MKSPAKPAAACSGRGLERAMGMWSRSQRYAVRVFIAARPSL